MTRILGIDPGSRITGYGIIDFDGRQSRHVASGCIRAGDGPFPERLKIIYDGIADVVAEHMPELIAVEQVFVSRSVSSALKLGQARGAALAAALAHSLPVSEFAPTVVKKAVTGRGQADKVQVQHMVRVLVGLDRAPQADAADALAVAICCAHSSAPVPRSVALAGGRR